MFPLKTYTNMTESFKIRHNKSVKKKKQVIITKELNSSTLS